MKIRHLAALIVLIFFMVGCDFGWYIPTTGDQGLHRIDNSMADDFRNRAFEYDVIPDLGFKNVNDILKWVSLNIEYDIDIGNGWRTPEEVYESRRGTCNHFAVLALYLIKRDTGIEGSLVQGTYAPFKGEGGHSWISIKGQWWEPQSFAKVPQKSYRAEWPWIGYIPYDVIMRIVSMSS